MKKYLAAAAMAMVIAMVGGAWANDAKDLVVTANIQDTCTVISAGTPTPIPLNPMAPVAVSGGGVSVQPTINCTKGSTHAVTCSSLNSMNLVNGGNSIAYGYKAGSVCGSSITGQGSAPVPLTIDIDIAANIYKDSPAGSYSDTITMTVVY